MTLAPSQEHSIQFPDWKPQNKSHIYKLIMHKELFRTNIQKFEETLHQLKFPTP